MVQALRTISVTTPLSEDDLLLRSMVGSEQLGRLFEYRYEFLSEDAHLDHAALLGEMITLEMELPNGGTRYFSGHVTRFVQLGDHGRYTAYQAVARPWLWFLTRASNCRIFQGKSVPDIIKQVFSDHGFADLEDKLSGTYRTWEYCVQYRETDFNFVSRLMEQEGIYYYFKHERDKHHLVLADGPTSHDPTSGYETIPYFPRRDGVREDQDHIFDWSISQEVQTGAYALRDFDFTRPKANLEVKLAQPRSHAKADYEFYDYPGEYTQSGDGDGYVRSHIHRLRAQYECLQGRGNVQGLTLGALFDLDGYPRDDQNRQYLVTSIHYDIRAQAFESGTGGEESTYHCNFACVDASENYRTMQTTPKPLVQGPQTAIVAGPGGEEIWTDEYGRIKVQFHWDREGGFDENSSCWVRVAQVWAGKNWGAIHIPRIGQEVIVEFLEGDPDRPIVTGRVYNGDCMPPYELPANKTQSGIKTRSSKEGGTDNFNEIRFEDKIGEEELYVHAEKDQTIVVENDRTEGIGRDRSLNVGRDKTEDVGRNKSITIAANHTEVVNQAMTIDVGSTLTETVGVNYAETVGGAMEVTVGGLMAITVGAAMTETVGGALAQSVGAIRTSNIAGDDSLRVGKERKEMIGKDKVVQVGKDLKEKIGGQHDESVEKEFILNAQKIQLVAQDEIKLKTGKAELIMKKNGDITIKGKKINVKGSGDVVIKGSKIKEN